MQSNLDVFRHDAQGISVVFECHTLLESPILIVHLSGSWPGQIPKFQPRGGRAEFRSGSVGEGFS